ncbi:VOC family protein [Pontibacter sp. H259]|uniref:VOC family protein n=1 Tax=Pontibacter sp. H259 TaxID=3133421 RepID=UPI0030C1FD63
MSSTKMKVLIPMLWTNQVQETIDFYTSLLGFTCGEKNDDWNWAAMHNGEVEIMVAKPNQHTEFDAPKFTGSLYIQVEDVESLWLELENTVKIVYPIETFEWGMREFAIYDNNGYMLQFGENVKEK